MLQKLKNDDNNGCETSFPVIRYMWNYHNTLNDKLGRYNKGPTYPGRKDVEQSRTTKGSDHDKDGDVG